eukprot:TRINITY_DN5392_c1_g1_i2.p1 TRINITY_DN5392_c1_g1~~TRINITY_DN5392_c1_g1_i2.p1  ORF type:complete len:267 (-),score=47.42 TRINITY_DN5392_c1_g1_i2:35-835(-)
MKDTGSVTPDLQVVTNEMRDAFKGVLDVWEEMKKLRIQPDTHFCNTFLNICRSANQPSIIFEVYGDMRKANVRPDLFTYDLLVSTCYKTGRVSYAFDLFEEVIKKDLKFDLRLCNSFLRVANTNVKTPNQLDEVDKIRKNVLEVMRVQQIKPDGATFDILFSSLGRTKNLEEIPKYWKMMEENRINPTLHTYTALIGAYTEFNMIDEIQNIYNKIKESGAQLSAITVNKLIRAYKSANRFDLLESFLQDIRNQSSRYTNSHYEDKK